MSDQRAHELLKLKEITCTLKKQPLRLTSWFVSRYALFNVIAARSDADTELVVGLLDRLLTLLKFVGKPNDTWRKEAIIKEYWPPLMAEIDALPRAS